MTDDRTPRRANISAISEATHTSRGRAAELLKAAGMRRDKAGTYLFAKACETILALVDPARSIGHQTGGDESALTDGVATNVSALSSAKAAYETLRTERLRQQIDVQQGKLIPRDDVIALAKDVGAHVKSNILAVPAKVAANCQGKDADEVQRLLTEALRDALIRLTDVGDYLMGITAT
jgi:hypothetical protein